MGFTDKAREKLKDAAGGVRGAEDEASAGEGRQPNEARFEPEEVRRNKEPKENLPQPEKFRAQD